MLVWLYLLLVSPLHCTYHRMVMCQCYDEHPSGMFCSQYQCIERNSFPNHDTQCLPLHSTVPIDTQGKTTLLGDLSLGDTIYTLDPDSLEFKPDTFLGWLHWSDQPTSFLKLQDEQQNTLLECTIDHLVYASKQGIPNYHFCGDLQKGDQLYSKEGQMSIHSIQSNIKHGYGAPLTMSGTLYSGSSLVSNYAVVPWHRLAHMAYLPARVLDMDQTWLTRYTGWLAWLWGVHMGSQ